MYTQGDMTTNTPSPAFRTFFAVKYLSMAALVVSFAVPAHAANKIAGESGTWPGIDWLDATGAITTAPVAADNVIIGGSREVDFVFGAGSQTVTLVDIGFNNNGLWPFLSNANGSLTVSSGTLLMTGSGGVGARIARGENSIAALNVTGGVFSATGRIDVGLGNGSEGFISISGGKIITTGATTLGAITTAGQSATGRLFVSGGDYESGGIIYAGRRAAGTNNGFFEQTGGKVTLSGNNYLAVGYSGDATQNTQGVARITGGEFIGSVKVGRQAGTVGIGSGQLTIGPDAQISGGAGTQAWEVNQTGELVFELGTDADFNTVNLTLLNSATALSFESGAKITIDGTNLIYQEGYDPITLFLFGSGKGPTEVSKSNVSFTYIGFDEGFAPELVWTDTSLQLNLGAVPEPSTIALAIVAGLGWVAIRRRRH